MLSPRNNIKGHNTPQLLIYAQCIFISGMKRDISDHAVIMIKNRDLITGQNDFFSPAQIHIPGALINWYIEIRAPFMK